MPMAVFQFTAAIHRYLIRDQRLRKPILPKFGPNRRHHHLQDDVDDAVLLDPGVGRNSPHSHRHPRVRLGILRDFCDRRSRIRVCSPLDTKKKSSEQIANTMIEGGWWFKIAAAFVRGPAPTSQSGAGIVV